MAQTVFSFFFSTVGCDFFLPEIGFLDVPKS